MSEIPGIHLKDIPEKVYNLVLEKQLSETKKKKGKINLSQAVLMLLKEAYFK